MEKGISDNRNRFELVAQAPNGASVVFPIKKKRSLIGRGNACDIVLPFKDISTIHAVIEVTGGETFKIFDLDSKNGTRKAGEKKVVLEAKVSEEFYLGDNQITLRPFSKKDLPPPPLEMLSEVPAILSTSVDTKKLPVSPPKEILPVEDIAPRVKYPLAKDPNAEFSEYIFEDADDLYPIFKYQIDGPAVEVIILFNDRIQSVDYIPPKDGTYSLVGSSKDRGDIEFAYFGKNDEVPLIQMRGGEPEIFPLVGYEVNCLGDALPGDYSKPFMLINDEIIQFQNQHIQIFLRKTESPPKVAHAPILRRDSEFKKYLLLMFFLVFSFLVPFSLFEVDEELEKEKAPERIATILYKRKLTVSKTMAIDKTKDAPKKLQKSPKISKDKPKDNKPKVVKPDDSNKKSVSKSGSKTAKKVGKVKKAKPNKGPKNVKKNTVRPKVAKKPSGSSAGNRAARPTTASTKSKGRVDTYKSADFKSTVSSLISKGGSSKAAKAVSVSSSGTRGSSISEADSGATLTTASVSDNQGSLTGVTKGTLDSSKGVEGLVDKKSIYTAGLPYKTVVLGGIDPDVIRQILIDNIPKFRFCYQKVLDRSKQAFNGIVRLNFIIGASGHVSKAGVDSISSLPGNVKSCVVNVLRRIRFPEPLGGGVVEVNQPMNFYPRVN